MISLPVATPTGFSQDATPALPAFLHSVGRIRAISPDGSSGLIFAQGDPAIELLHIQSGTVKKSVLSRDGREALVAVLGPGDFFGEECLAGHSLRMSTASALTDVTLLAIEKHEMLQMLHRNPPLADWFLSHTLARLNRIEDDLADQRCNPTEKRLARTLLLLARYGRKEEQQHVLPKLSQTMLGEMVGTTRSRINFFMNKFKRQGFIEYDDEQLTIKNELRRVVHHD